MYYIGPIDGHNLRDLLTVLQGESSLSKENRFCILGSFTATHIFLTQMGDCDPR